MSQYTQNLELIPTKYAHVFDVTLRLGFQTRHIGRIDIAGEGTFYTKRKKEHLHRKTNSLGLNLELVQRQDIYFRWIIIEFEGRKLITSREFLLYHGSIFDFSRAGFERQIFLNLDLWGRERAEGFERTLTVQCELFNQAA